MNCCLNDDIFIQAIIRQMSNGSPCESSLSDTIPALWELVSEEACNNQNLHMLLTKREVILFLMGCEAYSIDSSDLVKQRDIVSTGFNNTDTRGQSQSTGSSTKFNSGHGETEYNEINEARSSVNMDRHAVSTETGDGSSFYRDDGEGDGFNNSIATITIDSDDFTLDKNQIFSLSREIGSRTDCNYEYSSNHTNGDSAGFAPLASAAYSSGAGEWRKFVRTKATDADSSTKDTRHYHERHLDDYRLAEGTHDWLSQFLADIFWEEKDTDIRISRDRMDRVAHAEAHAQGTGEGAHDERSEAHNSAQGTLLSESTSQGEKHTVRSEFEIANALSNSQRFLNLQLLYDQLTKQIDHEYLRSRQRCPIIRNLKCCCMSRCQCGPSYRDLGRRYLGLIR